MTFANENMTILEYFQGIHNVPELHARNELAKVLFIKDDVYKKNGSLSGGEKQAEALFIAFQPGKPVNA